MIFAAYLGYRMTGRIFVNRRESQQGVDVLKALLINGPDKHHSFDLDDNQADPDIAVVLDTLLPGQDAENLYNLITTITKLSRHISTLSITPSDTMCPKLHHFSNIKRMWKRNRELSLQMIGECVKSKRAKLTYLQDVLSTLNTSVDKSCLRIAINTFDKPRRRRMQKEGYRDEKDIHDIQEAT